MASTRRSGRQGPRLSRRQLTALVEEAIVDAYGESEQRVGLLTLLQEHLAMPFATEILGTPVRVVRIGLNDSEEIVALCHRGPHRKRSPCSICPCPRRRQQAGSGSRPTGIGPEPPAKSRRGSSNAYREGTRPSNPKESSRRRR